MRRSIAGIGIVVISIFWAASVLADFVNDPSNFKAHLLLAENDKIKFFDTGHNNKSKGGGEFGVYRQNDVGAYEFLYQSFCLERNESLGYGRKYNVYDIGNSADAGGLAGQNGGGVDPISDQTAYLYHNFYWGKLSGYDYQGSGGNNSAALLQFAFWYFEEELSLNKLHSWTANLTGSTDNYFVDMANNAVLTGLWSGIGDVRVMNIETPGGARKQSQLAVAPVPEPATMFLFGTGLLGLGAISRRRCK